MGAWPPWSPEQGSLSRVYKMSFISRCLGLRKSAVWVSRILSPVSFAAHNGCLNFLSPSPAGFSKTFYLNSTFGRSILLSHVHVGVENDSPLKAELQVWCLNSISTSNPFFSYWLTGRHKWIPTCSQTLAFRSDPYAVGTRMPWVQFV